MIGWRLFEAGHCVHPEIATRRDGRLAPCQFPSLAVLLEHPQRGRMLFDTGYAPRFAQATTPFPERLYRWVTPMHLHPGQALVDQLAVAGIAAEAITWVLLSHLHGDHVAGVADFPQARVACARAAWDDLAGSSRWRATRRGFLPALLDGVGPRLAWFDQARPVPAGRLPAGLEGRDLFGDGSVLVVALPGHAPGHHGLWFEDAQGPVFLLGDAVWSSDALDSAAPPPALVSGWLGDTAAYLDTLARLRVVRRTHPHVRMVPAHCRHWRPAHG